MTNLFQDLNHVNSMLLVQLATKNSRTNLRVVSSTFVDLWQRAASTSFDSQKIYPMPKAYFMDLLLTNKNRDIFSLNKSVDICGLRDENQSIPTTSDTTTFSNIATRSASTTKFHICVPQKTSYNYELPFFEWQYAVGSILELCLFPENRLLVDNSRMVLARKSGFILKKYYKHFSLSRRVLSTNSNFQTTVKNCSSVFKESLYLNTNRHGLTIYRKKRYLFLMGVSTALETK